MLRDGMGNGMGGVGRGRDLAPDPGALTRRSPEHRVGGIGGSNVRLRKGNAWEANYVAPLGGILFFRSLNESHEISESNGQPPALTMSGAHLLPPA